jgi:ribosomal protein S18 acetylase RimI-like enzyme
VFQATAADVPAIAAVLAEAFVDDPVMRWVFPEATGRPKRLVALFALMMRTHQLEHGEVWTTDGYPGAAVWCAPDEWRVPGARQLMNIPALFRLVGPSMFTRLRGLAEAERNHPTGSHWYLAVLGTKPARQGTGVGSALLQPVLERCDHQHLGAYLESSKESNIAFYARHGFKVTKEIALGEGPKVWAMWREPK